MIEIPRNPPTPPPPGFVRGSQWLELRLVTLTPSLIIVDVMNSLLYRVTYQCYKDDHWAILSSYS